MYRISKGIVPGMCRISKEFICVGGGGRRLVVRGGGADGGTSPPGTYPGEVKRIGTRFQDSENAFKVQMSKKCKKC